VTATDIATDEPKATGHAPVAPAVRFSVAVTGHRKANACFAQGSAAITATLASIFDAVDRHVAGHAQQPGIAGRIAPTRLLTLLTDGTDQIAAELALARGHELVCPLPFGRRLNAIINCQVGEAAEARRLLSGGGAANGEIKARLAAMEALADRATLYELGEQDDAIAALMLASLDDPSDTAARTRFSAECAARAAVAGRILIEQADLLVAVWDGTAIVPPGGTGDTVATALRCGTPVLWINPAQPDCWSIITTPEAIATDCEGDSRLQGERLEAIIAAAVAAPPGGEDQTSRAGHASLETERWHPASNRLWHAYRRIEALFGSRRWSQRLGPIRQQYETPEGIAQGSGAETMTAIRAVPCLPDSFARAIETQVMRRFAWTDGISAYLSDCYRSGMTINFLLSALAISGGIAYLPLVTPTGKWAFALFELTLLLLIVGITIVGQRWRWHDRWFETRRAAEYLRHGPVMLALGVARPVGRWAKGSSAYWPEHYARHALRDVGLPAMVVTRASLRAGLTGILGRHVERQRDYHAAKALRLAAVHHNLDRFSQRLFEAAVLAVTFYLLLVGLSAAGIIDAQLAERTAKLFTVLGVVLPTFGAAIAGIRYFGDFERFSAISSMASEKLDAIHQRIVTLAEGKDEVLTYARVADLAHAADEVVVSEIESWQAVFAGKHITVPV
jgi:hypothetical protein